jgi:hypothetical protein
LNRVKFVVGFPDYVVERNEELRLFYRQHDEGDCSTNLATKPQTKTTKLNSVKKIKVAQSFGAFTSVFIGLGDGCRGTGTGDVPVLPSSSSHKPFIRIGLEYTRTG